MRLISQSLILISSFAFVYIWQQTFFSEYTIPVLGFFVFIYLLLYARKKNIKPGFGEKGSIFILNTVILLLIFSTGGLSSPLFFFLYFLGFGIAFAFEPTTVFVFTLGVIAMFYQEALNNDATKNLLFLGSLILISPLAFFFGREYRKSDKQEEKIENLKRETKEAAENITKDVDQVLQKEKKELQEDAVEKLSNVLEETEKLREETK